MRGRWASQRGAWLRMGRAGGAQWCQRGRTRPTVRRSSCQTRALSTVRSSFSARTPRRRRLRAHPHGAPHNLPNTRLLQAPSTVPRAGNRPTRPGHFSTLPVSPARAILRLSRTRCHRFLHRLQQRRHLLPRLRSRLISPHISVSGVHLAKGRRKSPHLPQNRAVQAGSSRFSSQPRPAAPRRRAAPPAHGAAAPRRPRRCTSSIDGGCRQIGALGAAVMTAGC